MESNSFVLSPVSSTNEESSWMHQKEFSDELRDTNTTTNNITSPLSSSSSLENPDLSDLLHLQSSSLPGSDSSSSENTHIKEESRHKQWKRKRQEEKTKCEKNRRNRFNEQLEMLRILVQQEIKANSKLPKFTRETVMSTAIDEIQKLRQGMSEMNRMLASTQRALQSQPTQNALDDPYNRISFSIEDLQRAFRVMLSKQMVQQHHMHKESTALDAICGLKMLYDVSKQTGKRENQLQVAALEQTFLTNIKFNMKNIVQVHESFWQPIQEYLKTRTDRVFLYDTDIGASLLKGLLLVQYAQGDFIALERTHKHLLEYFKKCSARSFKLCLHVVRTNPAALSLPVALKLNSLLEPTLFEHVGKITLGAVMVNYGQAQTGINLVERGVVSMMSEGKQNTCHLILAPVALEAYLRAGYVDRGLRFAKHTEKVFEETHMETYLGKAEILRLKANLLMLKKYPDFIPEPAVGREDADRYTTDLMDVYASLPAKEEDLKPLAGPFPVLSMLEPNAEEIQEDVNVEEMFWNALEMAHNEELVIVELRCSVDLIRYYMHIGNMELAWKTVPIVKEVISRMKGKPNTEEIIRANFVISLADPSILMKQVEQE